MKESTAPATAPSDPAQGGDSSLGGGGSLAWFLVASVLVIGLALYVTRWLARWQFLQAKGRRMRILEGMAIGRDRQLLLVQVGKEVLLLGSAEGGVNLVHKVEDPEMVQECLEETTASPAASFAGVESSIRANLDRMRGLLTKNGGRTNA